MLATAAVLATSLATSVSNPVVFATPASVPVWGSRADTASNPASDPADAVSADANLSAAIERAIERSGVATETGCFVLSTDPVGSVATSAMATWTPLVRWRSEVPLKPASNMKVLTTGAALSVLGPDFRFRTRLLLERTPAATRITVVGDGDPSLGDPDALATLAFVDASGDARRLATPEALLDHWVNELRARGVSTIDELVIDARIFDAEAYHPAWPTDGQALRPYCAEVWGLNFHENALRVLARGDAPGPLRAIELVPPYPGVRVQNKASVLAGRVKSTLVATRPPRSNALVVSGRLPAGKSEDLDLSVHDAPNLFGGLLAARLERAGLRVGGVRSATTSDPLPSGEVVAVIETPIAVVATRANTDSSNLHAECLLKRLASELAMRAPTASAAPPLGSWTAGATAVRTLLAERIGPDAAASFVVSDGSGLSHDNRVTASGLAAYVAATASDPAIGPVYLQSFARAGASGTVARRFASIKDSPVSVHCKTGYILGVSSLSGIAIGPDGRRVAFSILGNNLAQGDRVARSRSLQEAIVVEIVRSLEKSAGRSGSGLVKEPATP